MHANLVTIDSSMHVGWIPSGFLSSAHDGGDDTAVSVSNCKASTSSRISPAISSGTEGKSSTRCWGEQNTIGLE